jgi:hypothetical protein
MAGFECLTLAGSVDIEMFGPGRESLSEGTLSSCFGGRLPSDIPKKTQKAQLPTYSQDWSNQLQNETGLDLQKVGAWLPNASIEGSKNTQVRVDISFDDLERVQLSNIAPAFRSKIASTTEKSTLGNLDSCRKRLCKPGYLAVVEVLRGYPKITITTDGTFDMGSQVGWDTKKVDIGANTEGGADKKNKIVMERSKTDGPVVVAARLMNLSESMNIDSLCSDDAMTKAGTEVPAIPEPKGTKLGQLPLQADLPANATIKGQNSVFIELYTNSISTSQFKIIEIKSDKYPKTLNEMKELITSPDTLDIKTENLSDGWVLTGVTKTTQNYSFTTQTTKTTNYWVVSRREIGGTSFACETLHGASYQEQEMILSICKSLRPSE